VEFFKAATGNLSAGKVYDYGKKYTSPTSGQVIVPFQKTYNPQQVKAIADEAGKLAMTDESVLRHYNKILNDPKSDEWVELNKAYQSVYGDKDIVSTPVQAAQADAILRASVPLEVGEEQEINYAQRQQDKRINISLNTNNNTPTQMAGNAFDMMPDADYKNFNIRGGYIYNKDGTPYTTTGGTFISGEAIPAVIISALKSGGIDTKYLTRGVNAVVKDGVIQSISNKSIGTITREAMEGVYQKKMDTERKGESLNFQPAKPGQPKKKTYKGLDKNGNPIFE